MQITIIAAATCASILSASAAYANFVVSSPTSLTAGGPAQTRQPGDRNPSVVADQPHLDPGDREAPAAPKPPVHKRFRTVAGFGDQVPLSFACRQIVPARIRVSYGPGANPTTLVSWRGGATWPLVLGRAIKPLGLHIVEKGSTIAIRD